MTDDGPSSLYVTAICFLVFFVSCNANTNALKQTQIDSTLSNGNMQAIIAAKKFIHDNTKKYIYFTLDDGPQPPGTTNCLNLFNEMGIKASFFMVGLHEYNASLTFIADSIRKSYPQYLLCNHSYSHGCKNNYHYFYNNIDSAIKDFEHAENQLKVPLKIARLPGHNNWAVNSLEKGPKLSKNVAHALDSLGYSVVGWDAEWRYKHYNVPIESATQIAGEIDSMLNKHETTFKNNIVILMHDRMFASQASADSLRKVITLLKSDSSIVFETIDHYPLLQKNN